MTQVILADDVDVGCTAGEVVLAGDVDVGCTIHIDISHRHTVWLGLLSLLHGAPAAETSKLAGQDWISIALASLHVSRIIVKSL